MYMRCEKCIPQTVKSTVLSDSIKKTAIRKIPKNARKIDLNEIEFKTSEKQVIIHKAECEATIACFLSL